MVRRVRVVSILLLFLSFAMLGVSWLAEQAMLRPAAIHPLDSERYVLGVRTESAFSAESQHALGVVHDGKIQWGPKRTGRLFGIEAMSSGSIVTFGENEAILWPKPDDWDADVSAKADRRIWAGNRAEVIAPAVVEDQILVAWIRDGSVHVSPALPVVEDPPTRSEAPAEASAAVDGITSPRFPTGNWRADPAAIPKVSPATPVHRPSGDISFQPVGDRLVVLYRGRETLESAQHRLIALTFRLQEEWVPASGTVVAPAAEAPDAGAPAPNAETPSDAAPEVVSPPPTLWVRTVRPIDVEAHVLADDVDRFWSAGTPDGVVVAWRLANKPPGPWMASFGSGKNFSKPVEATPPTGGLGELPIFVGRVGELEHLAPSAQVDSFTRRSLVLRGDKAGEWREQAPVELGRTNLPVPMGAIWLVMVFSACGGVVGLMWLNVNRGRDSEVAVAVAIRDNTGRDTRALIAATNRDRLGIEWATITRRAFAFIIDVLAVAPAVILLCEVRGIDPEAALNLYPFRQTHLLDGLPERLVTLGFVGVYGFFCEARFGRTLGKMLLGLKVVTSLGGQPGLLKVFVRNVVRVVELAMPFAMAMAILVMVFTRRTQRLGDLLAGTGVRRESPDDDDTSVELPSDTK